VYHRDKGMGKEGLFSKLRGRGKLIIEPNETQFPPNFAKSMLIISVCKLIRFSI